METIGILEYILVYILGSYWVIMEKKMETIRF